MRQEKHNPDCRQGHDKKSPKRYTSSAQFVRHPSTTYSSKSANQGAKKGERNNIDIWKLRANQERKTR